MRLGGPGHRMDFVAARLDATRFNELAGLGTVGTVFTRCCLLETTTNAFHIRMLPNTPTGAAGSRDDRWGIRLGPRRSARHVFPKITKPGWLGGAVAPIIRTIKT